MVKFKISYKCDVLVYRLTVELTLISMKCIPNIVRNICCNEFSDSSSGGYKVGEKFSKGLEKIMKEEILEEYKWCIIVEELITFVMS